MLAAKDQRITVRYALAGMSPTETAGRTDFRTGEALPLPDGVTELHWSPLGGPKDRGAKD